jgi:hypothetical protein
VDPQLTKLLVDRLQDGASDPLHTLLLQQLAAPADDAEEELAQLRRRLSAAKRTVEQLKSEVIAANAMAEFVARLLGACPACWGLDRFCRRCLGSGAPGSSEPDVVQLVDWISPALHRAGLTTTPIRTRGAHGADVPTQSHPEGATDDDPR